MSINFVAIDFETANQYRASACSVGMVKVENGKITDTYYSLIDPETEFDSYNIYIHGITPEMVDGERNYAQIANDILRFTEGLPLVAHYAPFDMGVIKDSNERYGITHFNREYFDSYYLSIQYVKALSYKLNHLAELIDFTFEHHHALEDAAACATLILYLCKENQFSSIEELISAANYKKFGEINGFSRRGFLKSSKSHLSVIQIQSIIDSVEGESIDPTHVFFQKSACFTGKLKSLTRVEAMEKLAGCGGIPEKGVTKNTHYLVMGDQDLRVVGEGGKSAKIKKAEKLLKNGQSIQLLGEYEFLQMINSNL